MFTVLICGGRDFTMPYDKPKRDAELEKSYMLTRLEQLENQRDPTLIIHGNATGADQFAGNFFLQRQKNVLCIPAKWNTYGKQAGPLRNLEMLSQPFTIDLVVAFPGGRGTKNMISQAKEKEIKTVDLKKDFDEWFAKIN